MSDQLRSKTTQNRIESSVHNLPRAWETPKLSYVGHVADILQGGEGKVSAPTGDPGEARKVQQ